MFEGLDFDLPESIGISNEAPFQSLVNKIRAMQEFSSEQKLKRPRNDIFDVVTGTVESSDDE